MPILVNDYTWTQTENLVNVRVPLKAVNHEKVDLFTTDSYIKASFNPFLFEIFLLHDVNIEKSKCYLKEESIIFDLNKRERTEWSTLEKELTKPEKMLLKEAILEECQERAKAESEERRIKKSELDRLTVQKAMEIDTQQHSLMDSRREAQRNKAMDDLEQWRLKTVKKDDNSHRSSGVKIVEIRDEPNVQKPPKPVKTLVKSEYVEKKKLEQKKRVLPRLREAGQLEITHTPRSFPTPSRESQAVEEEAWLKNITLARRATGFVSEELRPEEQDPQWCKEKGDEFFRAGNFLGAVSAYTHGITLSDRLPALYANRAATHFALGNFNKCVTDCSSALDLLVPPCEGNRLSRAACIARRGAGLARLGHLSKAIGEMKAASKLAPDDEKIKKDIYDMERAWEQNPDSD